MVRGEEGKPSENVASAGKEAVVLEPPKEREQPPPVRAEVPLQGDASPQPFDLPRIRTFIEGFDAAIGGGIPQGHVTILCGSPGTMKSSLSFYILLANVLREERKGLYVTFEENSTSVIRQMASMGMPLEDASNSLSVLNLAHLADRIAEAKGDWLSALKAEVKSALEVGGFEIVVLDSLGALEVVARFKERRREIFRLFQWLRDLGLTVFVTTERPDIIIGGNVIQGRWDEDFLADGIIQLRLHHVTDTEIQRRIRCVKMRATPHETSYLVLILGDGSFRVAKAFSS